MAILGLVSHLEKVWQDDYCAGLWRSNFEYQLLWLIFHKDMEEIRYTPKKWQIPSWSWLSYNGPVKGEMLPFFSFENRLVASVTDVHLQEGKNSSLHRTIHGHIDIRGSLHEVVWRPGTGKLEVLHFPDWSFQGQHLYWDYADSMQGRLFYMTVCEYYAYARFPSRPVICGLLLRLAEQNTGTYTRCGRCDAWLFAKICGS